MKPESILAFLILGTCTSLMSPLGWAQGEKSRAEPSMQIIVTRIPNLLPDTLIFCEGMIRDSCTLEPLRHVPIEIIGARRGSTSNEIGVFRLADLPKKDTILFRTIGYKPKRVPISVLPLLVSKTPPAEMRMDSVMASLDSIDAALVKSTLDDDYRHREHNWYRDSAEQHKNVSILDSLLDRTWLPILPSGRFVPISSAQIDELVRQNATLNVVRIAGLCGCPLAKTIILEKMHCWFSKRFRKVMWRVDNIDKYRYRYDNGKWIPGPSETTSIDYAGPQDD